MQPVAADPSHNPQTHHLGQDAFRSPSGEYQRQDSGQFSGEQTMQETRQFHSSESGQFAGQESGHFTEGLRSFKAELEDTSLDSQGMVCATFSWNILFVFGLLFFGLIS